MDKSPSSNWRQMFERGQERPPDNGHGASPASQPRAPLDGYDDGHDPARRGTAPLSPPEIADEAAMALAIDTREYRPWILQRGRAHVAMMLDLRRYEPRSGLWAGWTVAYHQLLAAEYTGDHLLSLDFGGRQFMLEGRGLDELVRHIQQGTVLAVQEFATAVWASRSQGPIISSIRRLGAPG